jgi:acid phosphatase type 7
MAFNEHREWVGNIGPADGSDPIVIAGGDIAMKNGTMAQTANLITAVPQALVLALGDNAYDDGTREELDEHYDPAWGRFKDRTWTCPGNHDYHSADVRPFPHYAYFGERAGPDLLGYYSLNVGAWHLVCLNSEIARDARSEQIAWLKADLLRNSGKPILTFFHKPLFTSGSHGNDPTQIHFWHALFQRNAEIVLNGHDHDYERFDPQDPEANFVARGIREFIIGTGGKSLREVGRPQKHSVVRNGRVHGVLQLTLRRTSYEWRFLGVKPGFTDFSPAPVPINTH